MTDNITQLGTKHIKQASIPDMLTRMETSDTTIVIHLQGGRWSLQHMKGTTQLWPLIGVLQTICNHFSNVANGIVEL